MKTEAEALRQELARIAAEHIPTFPSRPMVYPEELIERVIKYVRQQAGRGQSAVQSSQELGIPATRLHYWLYGRHNPAAAPPKPPLIRPVQVSAKVVPVSDGVPERRYTLRSPAGWELSDLRLPELVELLRRIP